MQGLSTDWHGPDGLQLVAGAGVPGLFDGIEVPNFHSLGGYTTSAGAEWSPAPHWTVGGQLVDAHDVNLSVGQVLDGAEGSVPTSSTTGLVFAAWQEQGEHLQVNLLDGNVSGKASAVGAWVDGSITQGRIQQSAGLFHIDPNLTWGNQVIADDMQGGYYRFDYQSRQWITDVGIDEARSVSGLGTNTTFLTGDARYQLSRDWGVGGIVDDRGIFLTFRYKREAGLHFAPLGGAPGSGSGELKGVVYLDANNNGQPDAGEVGAPNVTVVLDGRYSVQTDANGRFDFPVVAAAHHVIQAITDNLPLPWNLGGGGRVEVKTRDHTDFSICAQRLR